MIKWGRNLFENDHREGAKKVDMKMMKLLVCRLRCVRPVRIWPTNTYNLSHLCSGVYTVLLPFVRNKTETFLWNTENIFVCQRPVCR